MDLDLKHYALPPALLEELTRADALAARLRLRDAEAAPGPIRLTGTAYNTALTILPQPMRPGTRVTWRGRQIARAA